MWVPGGKRRAARREQDRRYEQMRVELETRQRIEAELSGKHAPAPAPRRAGVARRLTFRGRKVLAPFAPLAVLWLAGLLAEATGSTVLAVPALWLIGAAGWWMTRGAHRVDRTVERRYTAVCVAAGAVWLGWASAAGLPVADGWLILGWVVASLPWWVHHWPADRVDRPELEETAGDTIPERWAANVAAPGRALPGAVLHSPTLTEHGQAFTVQAVPGAPGQQIDQIHGKLPAIAQGLRSSLVRIVLDQDPNVEDTSVFRLQVIDRSPIQRPVYFDEPRWENGKILLGPYADGIGDAVWRLYTQNSMWGGFVLGGTGGGKTALMNLLALTVRAMAATMPTTILYLDGQDGASSSTLWRHATWRGGPAEANDILCGLERALAIRQKWNRLHGLSGFTPGASPDGVEPGIPGVLTIIDEQHRIFNPNNGLRWANIAREGRKVGVQIISADQYSDLEAFGNKDVLRSSLLTGNGLALRTASRMASNLIPGLALDPCVFPDLPGYGYKIAATGSGERTAPFRARFLPDAKDAERIPDLPVPTVEEWFAKTADAPLDEMTARAFGPVFLDRHALAEQATQRARDEIAGRAPVEAAAALAVVEDDSTTRGQILAELAKGRPMRPVDLERATGKSKSGVRDNLRALLADGLIVRGADGYGLVGDAVPAA